MNKHKIKIYSSLFLPFFYGLGAFYIPASLGQLSSNAVYILLIPVFLLGASLVVFMRKLKHIQLLFFLLMSYPIFVSWIYLIKYEASIYKLLATTILYAFYLSPYFLAHFIVLSSLKRGVLICLAVSIIMLVAYAFTGKNVQDVLMLSQKVVSDPRPRGFHTEVSAYGVYLIWLLLLFRLLTNKNGFPALLAFLFSSFLSSKGFFIAMIPFLAKIANRFLFLIVVSIFALLIIPIAINELLFDYNNFQSVRTRIFLASSVLEVLARNPQGVGFGGFEAALINYANSDVGIFEQFRTNEVNVTIARGIAVSTKSAILDFVLIYGYFGIILLILVARSFWIRSKVNDFVILLMCLMYADGYVIFGFAVFHVAMIKSWSITKSIKISTSNVL